MLSKTPALKAHWPLALLLALFTVLTVYQSTVLPLGEADDETDHYQYLQFVARAGHPPLTDAERTEAGFKGGLAPLYYALSAWPIAVVGADTPPEVRRVDARPQRHLPTDGLGINHVLHTLDEEHPWRGQPLAWHLARLLSLPMGLVTIIVTYLLALRLCPRRRWLALAAAGFVALLPRFVFSSAVINDDNLVFALTALLLLVQVIILQNPRPPSAWLMAAMGGLFGLALVTKYFSLILLPEMALTMGVVTYRAAKSPAELRRLIAPLLSFFLALLLTAGVWFGFIALRFNRVTELGWLAGLAAALGEPQITEGLVGLLAGHSVRPPAATYPLPEWLGLLYRSFWFEFGWMRVLAPAWVYAMFSGAALLAAAGLIGKLLVYPQTTRRAIATNWPVFSLLALHLLLFAIVLLARYVLSATIDTGQGRHLFSALPVIALAFALGLAQLAALTETHLHRLAAIGVTTCAALLFLIPALVTLAPAATFRSPSAEPNSPLAALHSRFVSPFYQTHPVTSEPPPPSIDLAFAPDLSLRGLTAPDTVATGSALPVTLTWRAGAESAQDFLVSVCLKFGRAAPVGCWQGHFAAGAYPARAWETGDTLIDTVFVPIPVCAPAMSEPGHIELTVWALEPTSPAPQVIEPPRLRHTFDAPAIVMTPATAPASAALWLAGQRLTASTQAGLRQTLTRLGDGASGPLVGPNGAIWPPQASAEVAPGCGWSSFIVNPALPNGDYRAAGLPEVTLTQRERVLAPAQGRVTFGETVAPLTLTAPGQTIDLSQPPGESRIDHQPGQPLPVTIRWQARRWMGQPLVLALRLVDKDFAAAGERLATLGDRYPNVLWTPTELVEETYPVAVAADASPGLYRLEMGLIRQDKGLLDGYERLPVLADGQAAGDNLYPLTVRLLDPAQDAPPEVAVNGQIGEAIRLTGFDLSPITGGDRRVDLALHWQSTQKITADYTVFTQLLGQDGQVWAQWDNPPQAGRYPTSAWTAADTVIDRYQLTLREGAPPGEYRLVAGMYHPATGERLPARLDGQAQADNALPLALLRLE